MHLLEGCTLSGSYGFVSTQRKEQVLHLESADDVRANLPTTGLALAASLSGELARGTSLDIALVMVGRMTSTRRHVAKEDVGGACAGATHFVRAATVGAFAMQTAARGSVRAAAELFGAGVQANSSSAKAVSTRDGDLASCDQTLRGTPAAQCRTPLRLQLVAIGEHASEDDVGNPCPAGLVMTQGVCIRPGDKPHLCDPKDTAECDAQCALGDAKSCWFAAAKKPNDAGRAQLEKACAAEIGEACGKLGSDLLHSARADDWAIGYAASERGCKAGDPQSCWNQMWALTEGRGTHPDRTQAGALAQLACNAGSADGCAVVAAAALEAKDPSARAVGKRACDGGATAGCVIHALAIGYGLGGERDPAAALDALSSMCSRNVGYACRRLGDMLLDGTFGNKDAVAGPAAHEKACQRGEPQGCQSFAQDLYLGDGVGRDVLHAVRLWDEACKKENGVACAQLALLYLRGKDGVSADEPKAVELMKRGCELGSAGGCQRVARWLRDGTHGPKDPARAEALFRDACALGDAKSCGSYGDMLVHGTGGTKDLTKGYSLVVDACSRDVPSACSEQADLLVEGKAAPKNPLLAKTLYERACEKHDGDACYGLGVLLSSGPAPVKRDKRGAEHAFQRACDDGFELGCRKVRAGADLASGEKACAKGDQKACTDVGAILLGVRDDEVRDAKRAAALLQTACDKGVALACSRLASARYRGTVGAKDVGAAARLWAKGCDLGGAQPCVEIAAANLRGEAHGRDALKDFETACERGSADGCARAAAIYMIGRNGVTRDVSAAKKLAEKACDAGDVHGCDYLAWAAEEREDWALALKSAKRACDDGSAGCVRLGELLLSGKAQAKDAAGAMAAWQRGCDGGNDFACRMLGDAYQTGRTGTKDPQKAVALYREKCDAGMRQACNGLAVAYYYGEGITKDRSEAFHLFERLCKADDVLACRSVGVMLLNGKDVPRDIARAASLFENACGRGLPTACSALGALYLNGPDGISQDPKRAVELFRSACEVDKASCFGIGSAYMLGRGVPRDDTRAAEAFRKACDAGDDTGCVSLGVLLDSGRGVAKDEKTAKQYFEKDRDKNLEGLRDDCEQRDAVACTIEGVILLRTGGDAAQGRAALKRACELGEPGACSM